MPKRIYFAAFVVDDEDYGCATDTDEIVQYLSNVTTDEGLSNFMVWDNAAALIADHVERGPLTIAYLEGEDQTAPDAAPAAPQTPDASALMLAALRMALPVCEDAYNDAHALQAEPSDYAAERQQSTAAALAAWEAVKAAIAAAEGGPHG